MSTWNPFVLSKRPMITRPAFVSTTRFCPWGAVWIGAPIAWPGGGSAVRIWVSGDGAQSLPWRPMKLTPSPFIWFNGEFVPWDKAQIHVLSHGLHYGAAVFEGIRAYSTPRGPAVLALAAHVVRFLQSCKIMDLPLRFGAEDVRQAILDTVRRNGHQACYIRPIAWRGYGALGVWPDECPVEIAIATFPWGGYLGPDAVEKGVDVGVSSWRRVAPDTLPAMAKVAGNYVNSQLVVMEARRHGYHEGLVLDVEGYVSEGSGQNLFLVQNGRLHTPPVGASILAGVTRACVVQIA